MLLDVGDVGGVAGVRRARRYNREADGGTQSIDRAMPRESTEVSGKDVLGHAAVDIGSSGGHPVIRRYYRGSEGGTRLTHIHPRMEAARDKRRELCWWSQTSV